MSARRTDSQRAFSRRQWSRRWMLWRRAVVALVLLLAVGGAAWLVFFSPVLSVATVAVEGERSLPAQRIVRAAGIELGRPLARADLEQAAARVERLPAVREVAARRAWPDTVVLSVVERTAVATVDAGRHHLLIDEEGVQFREVDGPRRGLPTIVAGGERAAAEAAEVVAALPADVVGRVDRVDATTMDSITLQLAGGREVVWGSAEQTELKAKVLAVLVQEEGSVLNVSVPSAPTVAVG
ncbi:MAG TPA: FtsQ-type POTRA domain-containing protein [Nocardioidaceae bacterium]|nr:FtsQ-type POTRA domain-containing protein [Nocardioidaceae bacterium]